MASMSLNDQDRLFRALADQLLARITAGTCETCGRSAASHQELQVLRQFLHDNNITASATSAPVIKLVKGLPFEDKDAQTTTKAG